VERLVQVDDPVAKGQLIANIRNVLGDVIEEIPSPADERTLQSPSDLSIEPGGSAGQIAYNSTSGEC
jgi:predicted deacylase